MDDKKYKYVLYFIMIFVYSIFVIGFMVIYYKTENFEDFSSSVGILAIGFVTASILLFSKNDNDIEDNDNDIENNDNDIENNDNDIENNGSDIEDNDNDIEDNDNYIENNGSVK